MSTTATVDTVELPCGEEGCEHIERGPATGRGSAPFKLASHKYRIHGLKSDGTRREPPAKKGKAEPEKTGARAVLATVTDIAGDVKGEGAPTASQVEKAGAKVLQVGSAVAAAILVETDEGLTDAERDEVEDRLTLTSGQARAIAGPAAKAFAPTKLNKRFGRTAVDVAEVAEPIGEVVLISVEYVRYFRERRRRQVNLGNGVTYLSPPGPGAPPPPTAGAPAGPENPGGTATPGATVLAGGGPPTAGRVVSAEDVQAELQRRQGGRRG